MEEDVTDTQQGVSDASGVRISFKSVIQAVLLFRSETWVVTPHMGTALGGFQTQVARRLTGKLPWRATERMWK